MADGNNGKQQRTSADVRAERLAAALRENLKRRKAQARGRAQHGASPQNEAPSPVAPTGAGDRDV